MDVKFLLAVVAEEEKYYQHRPLKNQWSFFSIVCQRLLLIYKHFVDWSGGHETPSKEACQRETPQALVSRRLPNRPRQANAYSGNQQQSLTIRKSRVFTGKRNINYYISNK